jgi:RNA polymerase sigma-70 factor (ECF subfamily)
MIDLTDEELMSLFQGGEETAYTALVQRHKDGLTNYVYRFVGDWDDSEDIVQEAFFRVYRRKETYRPGEKFSTWLYTIASNLAKTRLRRKALWKFVRLKGSGEAGPEYEVPDNGPATDQETEESIRDERIEDAISKLPIKFREGVVLRDIQGLTYEEIAAITGTAIGTVKSRINRGRTILRVMLQDLLKE